jgi:hypothetical protein
VVGLLVLIVILQFVTAPVSAHLTVRVAFRHAGGEQDPAKPDAPADAADDGPQQLAQAVVDENHARNANGIVPDER